jgi:site-specific DNA-methyltransferase (adenine-specific)
VTPWTLHLGDCLDPVTGLASLADKSVDHVICDPPYSQRTSENARRSRYNAGGGIDREGRFIAFDGLDPATVTASLLRVSRRWVVVFCALEQLGEYEASAGDSWVRAGIWNRENGAPQFTGDRPAQGAEGIAIMHPPGKKAWGGGGKRAVWSGPVEKDARDIGHPTPKPIWLMHALVSDFTDPGDLICDPFAGSGTTGVAAIRLGRRFVGWERDPKYHAAATRRLTGTREQLSLLDRPRTKAQQQTLDIAIPTPTGDPAT